MKELGRSCPYEEMRMGRKKGGGKEGKKWRQMEEWRRGQEKEEMIESGGVKERMRSEE